jgi:hypothetical protein
MEGRGCEVYVAIDNCAGEGVVDVEILFDVAVIESRCAFGSI